MPEKKRTSDDDELRPRTHNRKQALADFKEHLEHLTQTPWSRSTSTAISKAPILVEIAASVVVCWWGMPTRRSKLRPMRLSPQDGCLASAEVVATLKNPR